MTEVVWLLLLLPLLVSLGVQQLLRTTFRRYRGVRNHALGYRAFAYWLPIIPGVLAYLRVVRTVRGWERQDERTGDAAARTV